MANNLFLFTGEETYLLHGQINGWKKAFIEKHGDINLAILDAEEMPLNEIMAAILAIPFLINSLFFLCGLRELGVIYFFRSQM